MQERILKMLDKATEEQVWRATRGKNSYRAIRAHAGEIHKAYSQEISLAKSVAILAVLSPIITWEENLVDARQICQEELGGRKNGRPISALPANVEKARRMVRGESATQVMRGQKVWSFFHSILHPDNPFSVCVDRHVGRVALGWSLTWRQVDTLLKKKGVYEQVAESYREVAPRVGLLPLELQAIAWLVTREGLHQGRLF